MIKDTHFPAITPGSPASLHGKNVAIIGGTGGIGRALSRYFSLQGANLTVVGQTFRDSDRQGITFIRADLSLMSEASRVATLLPAENLDMLIFTNGIFAAPKREETKEGLERDMAISYLSRLVILQQVAPRLGSALSTKTRVFIMGYPGSGKPGTPGDLNALQNYRTMEVHMNTVAGNEIMVLDGAKRYTNLSLYGLNPGFVKTNIRSNFLGKNKRLYWLTEKIIGWFTATADQYAHTITPLLVAPQLAEHSGILFNNKGQAIKPSKGITDPEHMEHFISQSNALITSVLPR